MTATLTLFLLISSSVEQRQGDWMISYHLKYVGEAPKTLSLSDISINIDSQLYSTEIPEHLFRKPVKHKISDGTPHEVGLCENCKEVASVQINGSGDSKGILLEPNETFTISVFLQHEHEIYGKYCPLTGTRKIQIEFLNNTFVGETDTLTEQYFALPEATWKDPDQAKLSDDQYHSAPTSLMLRAAVPGEQYERYPELPVRFAQRVKVSFWYYFVKGSEGELKARLAQYCEVKNGWRVLTDSGWEASFATQGRWIRYEKIFETAGREEKSDKATTIALDFRLSNSENGVAYIDDVVLEYLDHKQDYLKP